MDHNVIVSYTFTLFKSMYTSDHSYTYLQSMYTFPKSFHKLDLTNLDRPLSDWEVIQVVFSFKPFKALSPNGIHPYFYQKYWSQVKNSIIQFCRKVFESQALLDFINDTALCIIPKFKNANQLCHFRPIGLYNTIYKVVTKIIVNRLKSFLQQLLVHAKLAF